MKEELKYLMAAFMAVTILCGVSGCGDISENRDTEQVLTEERDNQIVEPNHSDGMDESTLNGKRSNTETVLNEEHNDIEEESSGEDLDVVVPDAADDDWYMKGNIYTDDKGNRLEVFFNDHGVLEFAVNDLSMYFTTVDNFQQENNWKVYTCDDGTMIIYYPGEPAHLEISDGDYAGLYEAGGDKIVD